MKKVLVITLLSAIVMAMLGCTQTPLSGRPEGPGPEQEAHKVMDAFLEAFNARDEARWADTLLFPHIRIASGTLTITPTRQAFLDAADLDAFAATNNWSYSTWDAIETIQADATKVHFKVVFSRHNNQGQKYVTYNSLYILQNIDGHWGIRSRSSFAP
jgi:hypothetical protein